MKNLTVAGVILVTGALFFMAGYLFRQGAKVSEKGATGEETSWQEEFNLDQRQLVPTGRNKYFILEPGYQIVLAGRNERVAITVLNETVQIEGITTRVVEEREWKNDTLIEVSRNFFAIDADTADVFYFGEDVDDYSNGIVFGHGGAWRAGQNEARPGLIMPGQPLVGQKYYQEMAPKKAMDRAEVVSVSERFVTPAGEFTDSLRTLETTPLNPYERGYKTYAPNIGLIQDEYLLLIDSGFIKD